MVPPDCDSEIIDHSIDKKKKYNLSEIKKAYAELKLITFGCSKGSVVFLSCDNFERIYARVTYHREAICNLESIFIPEEHVSYVFSMCVENYLKVVKFDSEK